MASFTSRNVSSQSEQPAVKTSIFLLPAIPIHLLLVGFVGYIPVQQHLSSVLPVSLHRSFPFFCFSQQQVFTSLLVRVHTIFCEAPDAIVPMANAAIRGSHFVILFINSPPSICLTSSLYTLESCPRSTTYFRNFCGADTLVESLLKKLGNNNHE